MRFPLHLAFYFAMMVCCLSFDARCNAHARQTAWKTQPVHLHCSNATLQQALEQVAAQANISILADGVPDSKLLNIETQATAETILTQIAEACDYSWTTSKTGFVLMQKRFTDEHERPEIVPDEMRAATRSILDLLQPIFTPQPGESMTGVFRSLVASLSPEEAKKINSWHGIPVTELRPELQAQAIHLLYMDDMSAMAMRLDELNKILAALTDSRIMMDDVLYGDGKNHRCAVLAFSLASKISPILLWDPQRKENERPSAKLDTIPPPVSSTTSSLMEAFTIEEAFAALQARFHVSVTILPKIQQQRRITLLLHDADAPQTPAAFAELYNWRLQRENKSIFLYRRSVDAPQSVNELGKAMLNALPADVARSLYARPTTLGGEKYVDIHDNYPQLPGKGDARPYTVTKIFLLDTLPRLRRSFAEASLEKPIAYRSLSAIQQRDLIYHLWSFTAGQMAKSLGKLAFMPPSRVTDPLHARLLRHGEAAFSIIGSGGDRVQVRSGPN